MKWRKLRHDKAIADFTSHIHSEGFEEPPERQVFMERTRKAQQSRRDLIHKQFVLLGELNAQNISGNISISLIIRIL